METTEKKPKNGFDRLKVKYAKLKAEKETLEAKIAELEGKAKAAAEAHSKEIREKEDTIRKQGNKIIELTDDLSKSQGEARGYRRKFEEAVRRMGWFRRLWYGYSIPQFTDEDHWHD